MNTEKIKPLYTFAFDKGEFELTEDGGHVILTGSGHIVINEKRSVGTSFLMAALDYYMNHCPGVASKTAGSPPLPH